MNKVLDRLQQQGFLVLDGAMGTQLFARGLVSGGSPEAWNVEHPDRVQSVHQAYVEAGSDVILTNSFGGTRYRMKLHDLQDRVVELNRAAAQNARARRRCRRSSGAGRRFHGANGRVAGPDGQHDL
ncbi:MAG: homocysteine S-methyltransferase family protein [Verrucomicrobiota bacterium]